MKKKTIIIPIFVVLLFSTSLLWGHGIKVSLEEKRPCVIANARYHGGKALVNAKVTISFEPGSAEFQTGFTDRNGNFCFCPDKPGSWMVLVDDLTGHRGKKSITLSAEFFNIPSPPLKETGTTPTSPGVETAQAEISPPAEEKPSPAHTAVDVQEKKESFFGGSDFCCYLLKIVLGVVLILAVAYGLYRLRKRQESTKE